MPLPSDIKPEDVMHPTGVFFRNPSHVREADRASNQSEIVKAIRGAGRQRITEVFTYEDKKAPDCLPGALYLREMDEEGLTAFFKSLLRIRPNIFKIHIQLGNYDNTRQIHDPKIHAIGAQKPRFPTEIAEEFAEAFSDSRFKICEILYTVHSSDPGNFNSTCEAYQTTEGQYADNSKFDPKILIEYFENK